MISIRRVNFLKPLLIGSSFCGAILVFSVSNAAAEFEFPKRKPGLWEVSVDMKDGQAPMPPSKQCIDENTDAKMFEAGTNMSEQMGMTCSENSMKKDGAQYVGKSVCKFSGSQVTSDTVISGDFSSAYTVEMKATYSPALMGMNSSTTKMNAKWLSPCEAGQSPGDMILPGGQKINLTTLNQAVKGKK